MPSRGVQVFNGNCRITSIDEYGQNSIDYVAADDLWYCTSFKETRTQSRAWQTIAISYSYSTTGEHASSWSVR